MTKEEVIALAREAGVWQMLVTYSGEFGDSNPEADFLPELMRFATLIIAAERERIIAANAPEIEALNAHIKALEDAAVIRGGE